MARRKYKGTLYQLLSAGDTITGAALDAVAAPKLALRLGATFVSGTVTLIGDIRQKMAERAGQQGSLADLTVAEQALVLAVLKQMSKARATAVRAFKGNHVKLHDEFCVNKDSHSVSGILGDALIISASLKKTENLPALTAKGWLPADTTKLDDAVAAAAAGLLPRTTGQSDEVEQTAFVNAEANELYEQLMDIQNAADIEWPEDDPNNVAVRAKFLLGVFPYTGPSGGPTPPPAPPAPGAPGK